MSEAAPATTGSGPNPNVSLNEGGLKTGRSKNSLAPKPVPSLFFRVVSRVLHSPTFDHTMGLVIMLNLVIIIVDTDHAAQSDDPLPWAEAVGWFILITFLIELVLRLYVLRRAFFKEGWNSFDFAIVTTDALFSFLGLVLGSVFPVSTLRVLRLCKLARVSKVFRVFPELRIMMAGLIGSFRAIFWGTVLLGFVLLVWSIIAVQFIHPLNEELTASGKYHNCDRCPRAYSSVMQSMLTFSQQIVTGDSWGQATIPLIEEYPITAFYFMFVFLSVGIAVMNLILGVVVNVAISEHDKLKGEMDEEKSLQRLEASNNLLDVCAEMDADGSGELTRDELMDGFKASADFRAAVRELDLEEEDMSIAFNSMDADKSGSVSYIEFVKKIYDLKNSDSQFALEQIKYRLGNIRDLLSEKFGDPDKAKLAVPEQTEEKKIDANDFTTSPSGSPQKKAQTIADMLAKERRGSTDTSSAYLPPLPKEIPKDDTKKKSLSEVVDWKPPPQQAYSEPVGEIPGSDARACWQEDDTAEKFVILPEERQMSKEILDALLSVSKHLQGEFRDTLRHIEASLELQTSNTSQLLSASTRERTPPQPLTPRAELMAVPRNRASGFMPAAMCCRV